MIKCTKCEIEKPETDFQTYWHSTQLKYRTRKICKVCTFEYNRKYKRMYRMKKKVQPEVPELQLDLSNNPNYIKCHKCHNYKLIQEFMKTRDTAYRKSCADCRRKMNRDSKLKEIESRGGANMVYSEPGKYFDDIQRRQTEDVLKVLGYLYNNENNIWYKEPWKTKDGEFPFLKKHQRKYVTKVTTLMVQQIINMKKNNPKWSYNKIGSKFNLSDTTVYKILRYYNFDEKDTED